MLATLADLKTYLGITDNASDSVLNLLLGSASDEFESLTSRSFTADTVDRIEETDGKGTMDLFLKKYPVKSFVKIERFADGTWSEIDSGSYRVTANTGIVRLAFQSVPGFSNYRSTYRGGFDQIPKDIQMAVIERASALFNQRNSDGISSETVNGDSVSYREAKMPESFSKAVTRYKSYAF